MNKQKTPPITIAKALDHLKTVNHHRYLVCKGCFAVGLYRQGLTHDLSKYSPTEFMVGARYFQGTRSPNNAEREQIGYSTAWLHHKGRNRHHYEYWLDYNVRIDPSNPGALRPAKMPGRYVVEMFMDRIAASKTYRGDKYTDADPWNYYMQGQGEFFMAPETRALLEKLLTMLKDEGEEKTFAYIRKHLHKKQKHGNSHI